MGKNQKRIIIVAFAVLAVFSVLSFAIPFEKNQVFWLAYVFGVFAVLIQLYVLKTAFHGAESARSKVYGFPIARIGVLYLIIQIAASLIFMILATIVPIWIPVLVFVILLAFAVVGFVATDTVREEVERQEKERGRNITRMASLRTMVESLQGQTKDAELTKLLRGLADEFRYSDPVSSEALNEAESKLERLVGELKNAVSSGTKEEIEDLAEQTRTALLERNRLCKLTKQM